MPKRRTPILRSPPVVCPSCRGPLLATWNPTDTVISLLNCRRCNYSFNFAAYRQACKIRALNDLTNDPNPAPLQSLIPGTS